MKVTVSAPGKIHLLGEHSVVYGRPALLTAINKRIFVTVESYSHGVSLEAEEGKELIHHAIQIVKNALKLSEVAGCKISYTSQIPIGSGLGSSAALAVATIGALMKFHKNIWNPQKINELAFEVEKFTHGNPSGADNTIVSFGGLVWFRKEFDFLRSIWSLPITSYVFPKVYLIHSGRPKENTKEMVAHVSELYKRDPEKLEKVFSDQELQTKRLVLALKTNNLTEFSYAIQQGEKNLELLDVVGEDAKNIIRAIEESGGVAKICGAGGRTKGSGMILCFHQHPDILKNTFSQFECMSVQIGEEGMRLESSS